MSRSATLPIERVRVTVRLTSSPARPSRFVNDLMPAWAPRRESPDAGRDADGVLDLAERKLEWIDARSRVLAGNVANADTPGYEARDVTPFASLVSSPALPLAVTDARDLPGNAASDPVGTITDADEHSPDGNAVSIEQQMRLIAADDQDQSLVTTLYRKYVGMTQTALGVPTS